MSMEILTSILTIIFFGFNINRHFNNEITFLPHSKTNQELQIELATNRFKNNIKARKLDLSETKKNIIERLKSRQQELSVSGVVAADKIAKDVISGKEKRIITPQIAEEIKKNFTRR